MNRSIHAVGARTLALAVVVSAGSARAQHSFQPFSYSVQHTFDITPGGNVLPLVDGAFFMHAWASDVYGDYSDYRPLAQPASFDPMGHDAETAGWTLVNYPRYGGPAGPIVPGTFSIPPAGYGYPSPACGTVTALGNPSFSTASTCFSIEPYGIGTHVRGSTESSGGGIANAQGGSAEVYAFSAAAVGVRGGTKLASGQIIWTTQIDGTSGSGGAFAWRADPVIVSASTPSGRLVSDTLFEVSASSHDPDPTRRMTWSNGVLTVDVGEGTFTVDVGGGLGALTSPEGHLELEVRNGVIVTAVTKGSLAGSLPPVGTAVPFSVQVPTVWVLDYDASHLLPAATEYRLDMGGSGSGPASAGCRADINGDGFVTGDDFDQYVEWFLLGLMEADYNGDEFVTGDDFDEFGADFEKGC